MKKIKYDSREDWLKGREEGIGSSEVPTIIGLNPFQTPYQLWRRKRGLDPEPEVNKAMLAGHMLEGAVADYYTMESNRFIEPQSAGDWLYIDEEHPHRRVSPDRLFYMPNGETGILECKTTSQDIDPDNLPKSWFIQLQYQLGVAGLKRGSLAWLVRGVDFGYRDFAFQPEFYDWLVEQVDSFWMDCVLGDEEPATTNVQDITLKYDLHEEGKVAEADDLAYTSYQSLVEIKERIKELEEKKEKLENVIKATIKDAEQLNYNGQKIATWKAPRPSRRIDTKALQADQPEVYEKYAKEVQGGRRLLIY